MKKIKECFLFILDIKIWNESIKLSVELYKGITMCKDFGLKDQILRAGGSILPNIAGGCVTNSDVEFSRFLKIGFGSSAEAECQLL
ncbi:MAG: four helix bundle protein [Saprospiraceae bacterium]|jgi:four helix bundle protein|nr:four helix bundle protein [Saprospiraceae bacterium]